MNRNVALSVVSVVVAILACFWGRDLYLKRSLDRYQGYIERQYGLELSLIENEMRKGKRIELNIADSEAFEARDRVREKIGLALSGANIYAASWSSDGHHGSESLKMLPKGIHYSRNLGSMGPDPSHSLHFATADDGTKLLRYIGWVESEWKRQYEIFFKQSEIDAGLKTEAQ